MSAPVTMLCSYYPKAGKEQELGALVAKHWPTLSRLGLVTSEPAKVWRAHDRRAKKDYFVELFQWKDDQAAGLAHQLPEVMAIWEPMGPIMESMQLSQLEAVPRE
jgi:hypothetical protein